MTVRRSKALENVDKLTWDWMTKTMHELDAIAKVAYKEAKMVSADSVVGE